MKEIIVTTQSNFEKKGREITRLFLAVNPRMTERLPEEISVMDLITRGNYPFRYLDNYPPEYPNGIRLVLKKKCPYCETEKEYAVRYWRTYDDTPRPPNMFPGAYDPNYNRTIGEIRNLNPGICSDCVSNTYKNCK